MRSVKIISVCFSLAIILSGCLPNYYPGIYGGSVPAPVINTEAEEFQGSKHLSLDLSNAAIWQEDETNLLWRGRYLLVNGSRNVNLNRGLLAYGGSYRAEAIPGYEDNYTYFGGGPEFNILFKVPWNRFSLGMGFYGAVMLETGDFRDFRQETDELELADNDTSLFAWGYGLYPHVGWKISENDLLTLQAAVGGKEYQLSYTLSWQNRKTAFWLGYSPQENGGAGLYDYGSFNAGFALKIR